MYLKLLKSEDCLSTHSESESESESDSESESESEWALLPGTVCLHIRGISFYDRSATIPTFLKWMNASFIKNRLWN